MNTSNLTIVRKHGGWIVREKATRKQVNQGILRLRKDALEFIDNLINNESQIKPSKLLFKSEFKKFEIFSEITSRWSGMMRKMFQDPKHTPKPILHHRGIF